MKLTRRVLPLFLLALSPAVGCGPEETPLPGESALVPAARMAQMPEGPSVVELAAYCDDVTTWDAGWSSLEGQVLTLINQKRAAGAACPSQTNKPAAALTLDTRLRCAARKQSMDLATHNQFSHTGSDGSTPWQRMAWAGYTSFSTAAENIAAGQATAQAVVDSWMASSGHCVNIMNPALKQVGIGYSKLAGSTYTHYWTQDFASP